MNTQETLNAKGKGKVFFKKVGEKVKGVKIGQKLKTATLSAPRTGYLAVLRLNLFGTSSHLADVKTKDPKKYEAARNKWYKYGGNRTEFDKVIAKGAKKKAVRFKFTKKKGADGQEFYGLSGFSEQEILNYSANMPWMGADGVWNNADSLWTGVAGVDDAAIATTVASATPIILDMVKIAGKPKDMDDASGKAITEDAQSKAAETEKGLAEQAELSKASAGAEPEPEGKDALGENTTGLPKWAYFAIGGGVLVLGGIITWVVFKKKK